MIYASIRGILQNEKYCGGVLRQKCFVNDCISRKHIRNVGQLPMYLTQDHHEGIVSRDTFNAVKAEFARRNAGHAPSRKQPPTPGESMGLADIDGCLGELDREFRELFAASKEDGRVSKVCRCLQAHHRGYDGAEGRKGCDYGTARG